MNPLLQEILMTIIVTVISLVLPPLVAAVVIYVRARVEQWKASLSYERLALLVELAHIATQASEQLGIAGLIENEARVKKAHAILSVQQWLDALGLTGISTAMISDAIESAVREGLHKGFNGVIVPVPVETEILVE